MTVHQVSALTGVSVRTLHHYDHIGLLRPACVSRSGYRIYDEASLARLQQILLLRELEFSLKDIGNILDSPNYDPHWAITQQIELLTLKKHRLERLITFAQLLQTKGELSMDFTVFDKSQQEAYAAQAKKNWGTTDAYREFEQKSKHRSTAEEALLGQGLMEQFKKLGQMKSLDPADAAVQKQVMELQEYITANYYTCTKQVFTALAEMYAAPGSMQDNIDTAAGAGTAEFAASAIRIYCK